MKKVILDLQVRAVERIHQRYVLLRLTAADPLPDMVPGQFVEVRIDSTPATFLRRPISICNVLRDENELWLLVAVVGEGTRHLAQLSVGDSLNCVFPLGNGFSILPPLPLHQQRVSPSTPSPQFSPLLVGGGVGVAPLLYLGAELSRRGFQPTFLLGARSGGDLLLLDEFQRYGRVFVTTEDGSAGERGFVTQHSLLKKEHFDMIYTCGPTPMMKAVVTYAQKAESTCEASLENMMACGLGACLCCVEKTTEGNLCVCKDGPVFNVKRLLWHE